MKNLIGFVAMIFISSQSAKAFDNRTIYACPSKEYSKTIKIELFDGQFNGKEPFPGYFAIVTLGDTRLNTPRPYSYLLTLKEMFYVYDGTTRTLELKDKKNNVTYSGCVLVEFSDLINITGPVKDSSQIKK